MSAPAPHVAAWEDFVLRLIAVWKLFHAVFFTAVGFGLLRLRHHNVVEFLNSYVIIPYHLNPEDRFVDWVLSRAELLAPHFGLLGWGAFFYAALFAAEGIGLYLRKHWAEYLVVIVTGSLLPIEAYELCITPLALWKCVAVIGNMLIVAYLVHRLLLDARCKEQQPPDDHGNPPPPAAAVRPKAVVHEAP